MDTVTDEIIPDVEKRPELVAEKARKRIDYSLQIDLDKIPETGKVQMEKAKEVIGILSFSAEEIEEHDYMVYYPMRLPRKYHFISPICTIEFQPGWGKCRVKIATCEFDMKTPESSTEFNDQLEAIENFLRDFAKAYSRDKPLMLNAFIREMNPPTASADLQ